MDIYSDITQLPPHAKSAVVAIGNFDAVHRGHQQLLQSAADKARELSVPLAVMTFEPHPRRLFRPDDAPFRVTPAAVKYDRLIKAGANIVYTLPFDWDLAQLSAEQFIGDILQKYLSPSVVVVGHDFHFGHNRSGSVKFMQDNGINVLPVTLADDGRHGIISATRIRGLIQGGHIAEANQLLGWPWEIRGVVERGDQRGRELGYPTANVPLGETIHPSYGVYATWVQINGEATWHKAATNIGVRPMFAAPTALVEAHLLDYAGDLYGRTLRILPVQKLRDEMKFDSLPELISQIEDDCKQVRTLLDNEIIKEN